MAKTRGLVFNASLLFLIICSASVSAYIDPGTGAYLATSLSSTILTWIAIIFASISAFFSRYLINPIKNIYTNHKKILFSVVILVLLIILAIGAHRFTAPPLKFDASLSGLHIYNADKIAPGYYLYEGKLMDIKGEIIKKWNSTFAGIIDKNGDYYAQKYYESPVWGRYSWNDSVIWEKNLPIHHEIFLTPENTILTFTKEVHEYQGRKVEFDLILEFDKNGTQISKWSTWDNLETLQEFHRSLQLEQPPTPGFPEPDKKNQSIWGGDYDFYYLNSITLVPNNSLQGTYPAFNPGNWIVSLKYGSIILILDKDTKKVLWATADDQIPDKLDGQHTPIMNPEGNIFVFDNGKTRGWSRVILIDSLTFKILWEYKTKNPRNFFSSEQGSVQLLPNSNLLITEGEKGKALELTPEKEIVWEFYHPEKQNQTNSNIPEKYGLRQEIYRMDWYDKQFIDGLLKKQNE